jgi:type VI protein secretion system component VasK
VIRDSFFRPGAAQAQVTVDVKLADGVGRERSHVRARRQGEQALAGSVVRVQWPAVTPGAGTKLTVPGAPRSPSDGPWALFRVLDKGAAQPGAQGLGAARVRTRREAHAPRSSCSRRA